MVKHVTQPAWADSLLSRENTNGSRPENTSSFRLLILIGAFMFAVIWSAISWESNNIKQERLEHFRMDLTHLSEVLDETLVRQLRQIDNALMVLRSEYIEPRAALQHTLRLLRYGPLKELNSHVSILDKNGNPVLSEIAGEMNHAGLSGRLDFRFFSTGNPDQLYIGDAELGEHTQQWGIRLARPILSSDGRFLGVVAIFLPPSELTRFMQPMEVGSDTVMTVLSGSGKLLSRSRDIDKYFGTQLTAEQVAAYQREATGYSMRRSVVDLVERGISHRWLKEYPLLLVVSRSPASVLAGITTMQQTLLVVGSIVSLILAGLLTLLWRAWRLKDRAKALLIREHTNFTEAQHIARIGNWEMDLASDQIFWSDEIFNILEIDQDVHAASQKIYLDAIHPDDREYVINTHKENLKTGQPYDITHRLRMRDGRIKWVRKLCSTQQDVVGKPSRSCGTLQDITERKRVEAEREAIARERMLLLESTSEGIYGVDVAGNCTFINSSGARMLGYNSDEIIGRNIHTLIHYQHSNVTIYPEQDCPVYKNQSHGNMCENTHEVFWRKDGTVLPVEYSASPIRDGATITGAVVTFSDITQRIQNEAAQRIAEKAFQTQEGMFVTDENGTILRINQAFTDITGFAAADIVGKNPRIRSSGRHDSAFYAAMWAQVSRDGAWKGEIWNRHKDGAIYPESVTITAIKGNDTAVTNYVATIHDISARKAEEEQIHSLAFFDPLTQLPNRRLLQDRLQQALAASDRSKNHGALMFIDLDRFKQLNDTLGHHIGDLLLQQVAQRLIKSVRQTDTVARLGGDEFVLLIEELGQEQTEARLEATQIGRKVLDALNLTYDLSGHKHHSTPSIGATLFCGQRQDWKSLLKQADSAMYQSKTSGRNTLSFFDPSQRNEETGKVNAAS